MHQLSRASKNIDMTLESLVKILDYSSDEIFVLDSQKRIIYVNSACEKHYGLKKQDVLGRSSVELFEKGYWNPSLAPEVYEKKKPLAIKQTTSLGAELLTTAIPILNDQGEIELVVTTARELQSYHLLQTQETSRSSSGHQGDPGVSDIMTNSENMKRILKFAQKIAATHSTVLIQGESGTGKGVLARYIHEASKRKDKPFLTVNCAAIPADLLESELFGYTAGAFTGANRSGKLGLLEAADTGTLFLDEIGELSLGLQAKLLQVIQEKTFIPVGSHEEKKVDIRIIAATNQDLPEMVKNRQFREDLFYRLNVIDVAMPPLRERREDIIPLTYHFLYKFNRLYEVNKLISQECLDVLTYYSWPGNVRQLENLIERLVVASESMIDVHDLPELLRESIQETVERSSPSSLNEAMEQVRRDMVRKSYQKHKSSRKVANDLKISQTSAVKFIKKYCDDLRDSCDER
ncbi:sigma-54 interaction domain-containing protein [Bacillus thermotolerans]|uniref:HTH-type transcriptional regulatory protein TyrR n=1 Tax=Bacillus thermotolerans TaxID=1221996 RepID=A0A0F5I735_BACTR|nr:sigma 54-interacting transcriptional regulator [Bacillus thermotolerans]KKB41336.1 Acetoacetate metabolism regulatory protein AtoC [Bacillus thermotolerans]